MLAKPPHTLIYNWVEAVILIQAVNKKWPFPNKFSVIRSGTITWNPCFTVHQCSQVDTSFLPDAALYLPIHVIFSRVLPLQLFKEFMANAGVGEVSAESLGYGLVV